MYRFSELEIIIRELLKKYHAEYALLFASYARNKATPQSDIDVVVFGGKAFRKSDIFAFGEDLRDLTGKQADVFEISELTPDTPFYANVMREGRKIA